MNACGATAVAVKVTERNDAKQGLYFDFPPGGEGDLDVNAATILRTMLDAHRVRSGCALAGMVRALELGRVPGWKELRVGAQDVDYAYSSLRYKKKKNL
jgi:hypothetical protein